MRKFLGVDQSYTSTGCVVVNSKGEMVEAIKITSDPAQDMYDRAWFVAEAVCDFAAKHSVTDMYFEGLAFGKFGNATRDLAGLLYTIVITMKKVRKLTCTVNFVSPLTLKKFATGSGKADKKQMIASLPEDVQKKFKDLGFKKTKGLPDIADAYWLAQYCRVNQCDPSL